MWSDDRSFLSDFGKFYTESKAKLYDWISDFLGIMRSGKLVSHASVWRKMHGDRWDYHDCYSTIPKYVDTYCTYSRPLHFTGNLFLSVLPQDNFIIMLFHFTFNQRVICPLIFFVIHPEKLPMAGGIYFIYAMYGLCVRNMVV